VLAVLGFVNILDRPAVLQALNPAHALQFFWTNQGTALFSLGGVVLVITGGEGLYADMGHFGRQPLQLGWFFLVLPSLLLNYYGQGALLMRDGSAISNPFYHLAPTWLLYPLIALATCAAIIASQALISGAFSLTGQA